MTLALNGLGAVSVRLLNTWTGAWIADVDYDFDDASQVLNGPASLQLVDATLLGTVDPRGSGRFGASARARVVAGAGGWDTIVPPRSWHNDGGVLSTNVLASTAAEVGEKLVEAQQSRLGVNFARDAGPASSVLAGLAWYVDLAGVTNVGPRPSIPASSDIEILSWDPVTKTAELASDAIVMPGTLLTDSRFDGTMTVRDVEQTFTAQGARATAWCSDAAASRLVSALSRFVTERAGVAFLRSYRYRVISQAADGRVNLQAVKKAPAPDLDLITMWMGAPGMTAKPLPGSFVLVEFVDGDPTDPICRSYADGRPLELSLDAVQVKVGTGEFPAARMSPSFVAWITAVTGAVNGLAPGSCVAPVGVASGKLFTE